MSWWCKGSTLAPGMSEVSVVSGSIRVRNLCQDSVFSTALNLCCIYLVFTMLFGFDSLLSACTVKRGAPFTASCLIQNLTLTERAPPALHLRSYICVHLCVFIVG